MKKIFLILVLITNVTFSQVSEIFVDSVDVSKVKGFTTEVNALIASGGGGASNPNIFVPSSASDFTSPNIANANKVWEVQTDINTGASNIDLSALAGVIIHFKGGSLTGTGTITGNKTDIRGEIPDTSYFSDTYTFAGTWKVTDISFNWFGLVADVTSTKYNNRKAVKNALYVGASSGHCDVNWYNNYPDSEWFLDVVDFDGLTDDNVNYGIFNTTHVNLIGHNFPKIHTLDNNVNPGHSLRTMIFQFFEAQYCTISGFELIGDRQTTTYTPEHKMGIVFSNNADYCKAFNNNIHDFTGDGIYFYNQNYGGYSQIPTQSDSQWTVGNIDAVTGALNAADTLYMSSNAFLDINTSLFQDRGYLYVEGRMAVENYYISFYDDTNTFIGKSKILEPYDRVYFPTGCKSIKLTMWYEAVLDTGRPIKVNTFDYPRYVTIENNHIHRCSRQGISNATAYTRIIGNKIEYIFGQAAGPCAGIDLEDGGYYTAYVEIIGNTFLNNSGSHLLLKWNRHTIVKNNWFGNTDFVDDGVYTYYGSFSGGFYAQHSPGSIITENTFINRSANIGRDQTFSNNYLKNTTISIEKGNTTVSNNTCTDVVVRSNNDTYTYVGRPQFYNNNFSWTKKFNWEDESTYAFQVYGRFDERNNTYNFAGLNEGIGRALVLKPSGSQANSGTGYIDGQKLYGYIGTSSFGFGGYNMVDISNSSFSCGYYNRDDNTTPRNTKLTNVSFKQYLFEDIRSYDDINLPTVADYKTLTYDNVTVTYDDISFTRSLIDIENYNVNVIFKNCTIESKVAVTNANFIDVDNKGTVMFINCTFKASEAEVYNFTSSLTSTAYVIGCTFTNVTFTARGGDVFKNNIIDGVFTP